MSIVLIALNTGFGTSLEPIGGGGNSKFITVNLVTSNFTETEAQSPLISRPAEPIVEASIPQKKKREPITPAQQMPSSHPTKVSEHKKNVAEEKEKYHPQTVESTEANNQPQTTPTSGSAFSQSQSFVEKISGASTSGDAVGTSGRSSGFGMNSPLEAYRKAIHKLLMAVQRYPASARRDRQQGDVQVTFVIHPDGRVSNIQITSPSPFRALNREGKALIHRVGTFPPLPRNLSTTPMSFSVNIPFRLTF